MVSEKCPRCAGVLQNVTRTYQDELASKQRWFPQTLGVVCVNRRCQWPLQAPHGEYCSKDECPECTKIERDDLARKLVEAEARWTALREWAYSEAHEVDSGNDAWHQGERAGFRQVHDSMDRQPAADVFSVEFGGGHISLSSKAVSKLGIKPGDVLHLVRIEGSDG